MKKTKAMFKKIYRYKRWSMGNTDGLLKMDNGVLNSSTEDLRHSQNTKKLTRTIYLFLELNWQKKEKRFQIH